jgi:hypothetical protein
MRSFLHACGSPMDVFQQRHSPGLLLFRDATPDSDEGEELSEGEGSADDSESDDADEALEAAEPSEAAEAAVVPTSPGSARRSRFLPSLSVGKSFNFKGRFKLGPAAPAADFHRHQPAWYSIRRIIGAGGDGLSAVAPGAAAVHRGSRVRQVEGRRARMPVLDGVFPCLLGSEEAWQPRLVVLSGCVLVH